MMTDKAYIVANKEQELDVLNKFELKGLIWLNGKMPTNWVPSKDSSSILFEQFPYALVESESENKKIAWLAMSQLTDEEIVYDGRKEEKMYKKYKVTNEFMDKLVEWRDKYNLDATSGITLSYMVSSDQAVLPHVVVLWWETSQNPMERNNRLIAIIQWLNGEDVFEVEAPHKFVVRSDKKDYDGCYAYVAVENDMTTAAYTFVNATKFDTLEEAQEWANSHQVVIEIDEDGNEVE